MRWIPDKTESCPAFTSILNLFEPKLLATGSNQTWPRNKLIVTVQLEN